MGTTTGHLILQRFLALFLFAGAFCFGIAVLAAVDGVLKGQGRSPGMLLAVTVTAWTLGWLGLVLWSGRRIPRWFIAGFFLMLLGGQLVCACRCNTWSETGVILGTFVPSALSFRSILRDYHVKPAKPLALDEF